MTAFQAIRSKEMEIEDLAHIAFVLGLIAAVFLVNMQIDMALVASGVIP